MVLRVNYIPIFVRRQGGFGEILKKFFPFDLFPYTASIPGRKQKIRFTFWKLFCILYGKKLSVNFDSIVGATLGHRGFCKAKSIRRKADRGCSFGTSKDRTDSGG
jgi:hypothetical protein